MRILVVSHTYITPENRGKLEAMGRRATVRALVPEQGEDIAGVHRASPLDARSYELVTLPTRGATGRGTRWLFRSCDDAWKGFDPDIVLIEQEVWSLAMMQGRSCRRRHAPRSALGIHCWENRPRSGWKRAVEGLFYRSAISASSVILVGGRDTYDYF